MTKLWIDANIVVRFLTQEPPDLAQRSLRLIQRAERGEVTLKLTAIVVAEIVWVLRSFYKYPQTQIADTLISFFTTDGLEVESLAQVIAALEKMASATVDFIDAYLAEVVRQQSGTIASFDRDFRRLDISWIEPD